MFQHFKTVECPLSETELQSFGIDRGTMFGKPEIVPKNVTSGYKKRDNADQTLNITRKSEVLSETAAPSEISSTMSVISSKAENTDENLEAISQNTSKEIAETLAKLTEVINQTKIDHNNIQLVSAFKNVCGTLVATDCSKQQLVESLNGITKLLSSAQETAMRNKATMTDDSIPSTNVDSDSRYVIVSGIPETSNLSALGRRAELQTAIDSLIEEMDIDVCTTACYRLGKLKPGNSTPRMVQVQFASPRVAHTIDDRLHTIDDRRNLLLGEKNYCVRVYYAHFRCVVRAVFTLMCTTLYSGLTAHYSGLTALPHSRRSERSSIVCATLGVRLLIVIVETVNTTSILFVV
uniref:Phosphoprotein n=1 Tax=Panagrellus redivivus TaxID=6233 RepID=A0A7E4ZR39_PANRE